MTQVAPKSDAMTEGKLQWAVVTTFNCMPVPDLDVQASGNGSGDMTGVLRLLNDGTELPFDYKDGRFPLQGDDKLYFDEHGYSPANGSVSMSWPVEGEVLLVEVVNGVVGRWTLPHLLLRLDNRYLQSPSYARAFTFTGLHCVVDLDGPNSDEYDEFPREGVIYVGTTTDQFLAKLPCPFGVAIYKWDLNEERCVLVRTLTHTCNDLLNPASSRQCKR